MSDACHSAQKVANDHSCLWYNRTDTCRTRFTQSVKFLCCGDSQILNFQSPQWDTFMCIFQIYTTHIIFKQNTVDAVIFTGGKFRDYAIQILHVNAIFAIFTNTNSYQHHVVISMWEIFVIIARLRITQNLSQPKNFHFCSKRTRAGTCEDTLGSHSSVGWFLKYQFVWISQKHLNSAHLNLSLLVFELSFADVVSVVPCVLAPYLLSAFSISMTTSTDKAIVIGCGLSNMLQSMPLKRSSCARHWEWWVCGG